VKLDHLVHLVFVLHWGQLTRVHDVPTNSIRATKLTRSQQTTNVWHKTPASTDQHIGCRVSTAYGCCQRVVMTSHCYSLVSRRLPSPFSANMATSETIGQGWRAILTQWKKASNILTSTPAAFSFSSHPERERDRETHLNYYASAYNRGRQLSHCKTKLNQIQQNTTINLN